MRLLIFTSAAVLLLVGAGGAPHGGSADYDAVESILQDNCVMCHAGPKAPRGLRLDSHENMLRGSEDRPVVQPGDPDASELVKRIRGTTTPRMPLSGPPWLDEGEIRVIEEWIRAGAQGTPDKKDSSVTLALRAEGVTYKDIAPILRSHCMKCHNTRGLMGRPPEGLVLANYREMMSGTERAYVIPGNPDASELVRKIRGQSLPRMPFDGPPYLSREEISLVERWVAEGAKDETGAGAEMPVGRKVRLRGRLVGPATLDGLQLELTGGMMGEKRTRVGDYVEVRGRVTPRGGIAVDRIRER